RPVVRAPAVTPGRYGEISAIRKGTPYTSLIRGRQGAADHSREGGKNETASKLQAVARARCRIPGAPARARRHRLRRATARPAAEQRDDGAGEGSLAAGEGLQE